MPVEAAALSFRFVLHLIVPDAQLPGAGELSSHGGDLLVVDQVPEGGASLPDVDDLPDRVVGVLAHVVE